MNKTNMRWSEEIVCEGGPVLVANLSDFRHWRGAEPFDSSQATELHYWSAFTSELPEQWQPNGPNGHQYLAGSNPGQLRDELIALVQTLWPGTSIDRAESIWRATRPDGKRLNIALSPNSEYDNAIKNLEHEGIHHFGGGASGYLWSATPGLVNVSVDENRDVLLMSQVEYADGDDDVQVAYAHVLNSVQHDQVSAIQYRVSSGPVFVVWSPNSVHNLAKPIDQWTTTASAPGKLLDLATDNSGALLWLEPGLYEASLHYHEEGSWAISWCRLQRVNTVA